MNYLEKYYDDRVRDLEEREFLKQVGHTESGAPITPGQFHKMVDQLQFLLDLNPNDTFMDLCCGNGIITKHLAADVKLAVGVELSENMVKIAKTYHGADHIRYFKQDLFKLSEITEIEDGNFSKILMHGALQHFSPNQFEDLLQTILPFAADECTIVFGFVPQFGRQRHFFNTPKRKITAFLYRLFGRDVFGNWWDKKFVSQMCSNYHMSCSFHEIDESLDASKYRFNIKIVKNRKYDAG